MQRGQCPNFSNCNIADSRAIVSVEPGAEFRCTECNSKLRPVETSVRVSPKTLMIGGAGLLAVVGAVCWTLFSSGHRHESATVAATPNPSPTPPPPTAVVSTPTAPPDERFAPLTPEAWKRMADLVRGPLVDEPITFRQGQTRLSADDQSTIRDSLTKLDRYPRSRILVEAHVDRSESPQEDQKLSDQRALEVKRFLTQDCGLPLERVFAKGFGSDQTPERLPGESETEWKRRCRSVRILLVGE